MNKFQAMAKIMMILNEDGLLRPGTRVHKILRRMVSEKIDRLGPEAAIFQVVDRQAQIRDHIRMLNKMEGDARK